MKSTRPVECSATTVPKSFLWTPLGVKNGPVIEKRMCLCGAVDIVCKVVYSNVFC